jgi:hypothetical protein
MMSTGCSKHVETWNKYIEKEYVKLAINQNYVEMLYGQQNIKFCDWDTLWLSAVVAVGAIYQLMYDRFYSKASSSSFVTHSDIQYHVFWVDDRSKLVTTK